MGTGARETGARETDANLIFMLLIMLCNRNLVNLVLTFVKLARLQTGQQLRPFAAPDSCFSPSELLL